MRWSNQYERLPVFGTEHAIATSHPTATAVGHAVLAGGGNAVDAVLAAHAVLCVVEPGMTGVGGDCFAIYYDASRRKVVAVNGSGYAPAALPDDVAPEALHPSSAVAVTIPGAVHAWHRLANDYGTRPLDELFAPAIRLAEEGAPVHARVAWDWANEAPRLALDPIAREVLLRDGKAPRLGDRHGNPRLAQTLAAIAKPAGCETFYTGWIAEDIVESLKSRGGAHSLEDMAEYSSKYVQPVATTFGDRRILECPPNTQGVIALLILNLLTGAFARAAPRGESEQIHLLAEATKEAYAVRDAELADEDCMRMSAGALLAQAHDPAAAAPAPGRAAVGGRRAPFGDTTYLCAVDRHGNCLSFINSLYEPFGSCIMARRSGILLNNRGMCFTTEPGHANRIGPRKRPMHTIIPGMMVAEDGLPIGPFGVMGGDYQAAGHADFVRRVAFEGLNPQQAINAPRTFAIEGVLRVEPTLDGEVRSDLESRGHRVIEWEKPIGGAQAILIDRERGVLCAASDPRKDGCAIAL
jgi:gamma-glutamyltranspeptidase/glutathione hydrolase